MSENNHKLYELTASEDDIRFRHANPNPLSAEQKHDIIMAFLALIAGGLYVVLTIAVINTCGFLGLLLMLAVAVIAVLVAREF